MIKRLLALALLAAPAVATAQSVPTTATVLAVVTPTITDMNFGDITPNVAQTVTADAANAAPKSAGIIALTFNSSTATVKIPASVTLNRTGGGSMSATLSCGSAATVGGAVTSQTAAACAAGVSFSYNGDATKLATGALYIGGSIAATESQFARAGVYNGSIVATITNPAN